MADKFKEIGAILAAARREQHRSLKEAEESTKIMTQYLEAIEAGESEKLPTREYFMLFARGYAQYLGVDPSILEGIEEAPIAEKEVPEPTDEKATEELGPEGEEPEVQAKKFGKTLLYLIIGIVVVFAAFFVYIQWFAGTAENTTEPGYTESTGSQTESGQSPAKAAPKITIPDQPYQPPGKLDLRMVARQDVWTVVVRDGDTVLNRKLLAGQQRQWEAEYRYKLTLGISNGVDLYVNGDKLAPLTVRPRTIAGFEINQVNYRQFFNPPTDTTVSVSTPPSRTAQPKSQTTEDDSWIERRPETDTATQAQPAAQEPDTAQKTQPVQQDSQTETPPAIDTGGTDGN
jgi:cytoskeletal protein RodZ